MTLRDTIAALLKAATANPTLLGKETSLDTESPYWDANRPEFVSVHDYGTRVKIVFGRD